MRKLWSPVKKIYITQGFGENPDMYKKYGLKGHNGIDFRAFDPQGNRTYHGGVSEVFAPHSGVVLENLSDRGGYGWYVKIENDEEGSVLAHLSSQSALKVGQELRAGDFVGYQGTTGFSTGIHLHWGYYTKPRNRANGYNGYVNQLEWIVPLEEANPGSPGDSMITLDRKKFEELVTKSSRWDELKKLGYNSVAEIERAIEDRNEAIKSKNEEIKTERERAEANRKQFNELLALVAKAVGTVQEIEQVKSGLSRVEGQLDQLDDLSRQYAALQVSSGQKEEELRAEIAKLKEFMKQENNLTQVSLEKLLREIIRRLTTIIKE